MNTCLLQKMLIIRTGFTSFNYPLVETVYIKPLLVKHRPKLRTFESKIGIRKKEPYPDVYDTDWCLHSPRSTVFEQKTVPVSRTAEATFGGQFSMADPNQGQRREGAHLVSTSTGGRRSRPEVRGEARRPLTDDTRRCPGGADDTNTGKTCRR